jgi:hypothetical protein
MKYRKDHGRTAGRETVEGSMSLDIFDDQSNRMEHWLFKFIAGLAWESRNGYKSFVY